MAIVNKFATLLSEHLTHNGYPQGSIRVTTLEIYGEYQHIVEVVGKDYVIQAFFLASEEYRHKHYRIPFYKTYTQTTASGLRIYPACSVAVYKENKWHFYNASETIEPMLEDFVCYNKAIERFTKRLELEKNPMGFEALKKRTTCVVLALLLYLCGHIVMKDIIPLDSNVVVILVASALFFILPGLLMVLDKVSFNGIELQINRDMI